jgi:hypothetical protein
LGNLLHNVANLLNPDGTLTLLSLLTQLGKLTLPAPAPALASIQRIEQPADVNGDEHVTPLDVLHVVNYINQIGPGLAPVAEGEARERILLDVSGDGFVTPLDALLIINHLNATDPAEGESADVATDLHFAESAEETTPAVDDSLMALVILLSEDAQRKRRQLLPLQP